MSDDYRHSAFWQDRYEQGAAGWDKGQAAPPLVRALAGDGAAPGARVLVPGCGYGHEALHLARLGYQVVAIDFAPAAVARLRQRAADLSLEAVECDIFALPANYNRLFDLVVEHTCFCAIPLDRRDDYAGVMARVLRPGGTLLGLFWELGEEGGPPHNTSRRDLQRHFGSLFELGEAEQPGDSFAGRRDEEWLVRMTKE